MNAKYKQLIDSIRRGEGDDKEQAAAAGEAIAELMQEATEVQDLLAKLRPLQMGLSRGNFLAKQRAAYEASHAQAVAALAGNILQGGE